MGLQEYSETKREVRTFVIDINKPLATSLEAGCFSQFSMW